MLKWYPNAQINDTYEAYGKTWSVDKVEEDGATIVFRSGEDTAIIRGAQSNANTEQS